MRVTRAVVLCVMVALPAMPAWAQGQASDVVKADEAVTKALAAGDRAGASKLLDADFSWVDPDGIYYATRDEAFRAGVRPLVGVGADVKVLEHRYGKLVYLERSEGDRKFSGHFWAQRASGWRLLHINDIEVRQRDYATVQITLDRKSTRLNSSHT